MVSNLCDRRHRAVLLLITDDPHFMHSGHRARITIIGSQHLVIVHVPDAPGGDIPKNILTPQSRDLPAIDKAAGDSVSRALHVAVLDHGVARRYLPCSGGCIYPD